MTLNQEDGSGWSASVKEEERGGGKTLSLVFNDLGVSPDPVWTVCHVKKKKTAESPGIVCASAIVGRFLNFKSSC